MKKYKKESWISPKVEIKASKLEGKGMFARRLIKKGEVVVIWGGKFVDKERAEKAKKKGKLVMQLDSNLYSLEERGDDPAYYINHSCNPNIWMKDEVTLITRRDIKVGEELTADYALWEANENYIMPWKCNCGSKLCRKKITGKDWRIKELQKRYEKHFSPLINKRIAKLRKNPKTN